MDEIIKCELYNIKSILKDEKKIKRTTIINILRLVSYRLCLFMACVIILHSFDNLFLDIIATMVMLYQLVMFGQVLLQGYNMSRIWTYKVPNLDSIEDLYLSISNESYKENAYSYYWYILLYVNGEINEKNIGC